jgi:hypothetical protein
LILSASYAGEMCQNFSGKYSVDQRGCIVVNDGATYPDYTYTGMEIFADASAGLSMHYLEGSRSGFIVNYIADGNEHMGDVYNSGKTYIANCEANQIKSTRFGILIAPFEMSFVNNLDGSFTLTESITTSNHQFIRSCSMVLNH